MSDTIPIGDNLADYITIKTKDEWGRESRMEFCVADIQRVAVMFAQIQNTWNPAGFGEKSSNDSAVSILNLAKAANKQMKANDSAANTIR